MPEKNRNSLIAISTGSIIRVFLVALGFFLIWKLRDLVLIILTSIVIASFVEAAVSRMKKIGFGRVSGVVVLYVVSILTLSGLFYLFAPLLITEIYNFSSFLSSYIPNAEFLDYFQNEAFSGARDAVSTLSGNFSFTSLLATSKAFIANLSGGFFQVLSVAFGSIFNVTIMIVISFYLSIQEKGIENFLRIVVPLKHEDYAIDLWNRSSHKIALWMKGQMLLGLIIGTLVYLVLSLIGVQYALLIALIIALFELVPYGYLIAMVPAVALGYLSGGLTVSLMVAGALLIIHQFETYLLAPLIIRKVTGLSPLIVILAVLIGYSLAGIWGVILAIPCAVSLMEFLNDIEKNKVFIRTKNESR
ncbi:AI-2E family transporter [Patescibacteria group bacterium]|nr:AI-2E family transporter [Patescibacteria group bacterium]MBU1728032.1 AI-2E family transporter [Patescibacteria group bacterium]